MSDQPSPDASGAKLEVRRLRAAKARLREVVVGKDELLAGKEGLLANQDGLIEAQYTLIEAQREHLGNYADTVRLHADRAQVQDQMVDSQGELIDRLTAGMSHICTGVNPASGTASSSGCPHVQHSAGSTRSTWSTWSEGSSPEPSRPLCPPGLRVLDRSRCDAAFCRLALAAGGSELGGREEFELSIDSRRRNSAFSAAELTDPSPPRPSPLRAAAHAYQAAFDDLASHAHLAA